MPNPLQGVIEALKALQQQVDWLPTKGEADAEADEEGTYGDSAVSVEN